MHTGCVELDLIKTARRYRRQDVPNTLPFAREPAGNDIGQARCSPWCRLQRLDFDTLKVRPRMASQAHRSPGSASLQCCCWHGPSDRRSQREANLPALSFGLRASSAARSEHDRMAAQRSFMGDRWWPIPACRRTRAAVATRFPGASISRIAILGAGRHGALHLDTKPLWPALRYSSSFVGGCRY